MLRVAPDHVVLDAASQAAARMRHDSASVQRAQLALFSRNRLVVDPHQTLARDVMERRLTHEDVFRGDVARFAGHVDDLPVSNVQRPVAVQFPVQFNEVSRFGVDARGRDEVAQAELDTFVVVRVVACGAGVGRQ